MQFGKCNALQYLPVGRPSRHRGVRLHSAQHITCTLLPTCRCSVLEFDRSEFFKAVRELPHSFTPDLVSGTIQQLVGPGGTVRRTGAAQTPAAGSSGVPAASQPACSVSAEFHLTQAREPSGHASANIRPELQACLRFGRPDWGKVFAGMAAEARALGEARVAVAVCGPPGMVSEVEQWCRTHSGPDVAFDVHAEVFEF
jgi:hypothetical protein